MDKLPFTVYDFFGYLAAGFVTLVGVAASFTDTYAWQHDVSTVVSLLLVVLAYATGQIVANISGLLLERGLADRALGKPTVILFGDGSGRSRRRRFFPGYYGRLPEAQRKTVLDKSGLGPEDPDSLWHCCFDFAKSDDSIRVRVDTFLNLYGFCRNMAMALVIAGGCLIAGSLLDRAKTGAVVPPGWCAAAALVMAVGLFYRYLKFYRLRAHEVYVSYAERAKPRT